MFLRLYLFIIIEILTLTGIKAQPSLPALQPVTIGLLITDSRYKAAEQGCELAIQRANTTGGLNGNPFKLIVRSMEGPWGTGSKQAVDLIFNEKAWALIGSHDGRNAHLVEQAATKTTIVFLSAWPGDPTLSQAFVPWFFNCVPNDHLQAKVLVNEIFEKRKLKKTAVISDNDYDSRSALSNFLTQAGIMKNTSMVQFSYEDYSINVPGLIDKIKSYNPGCIILFCKPETALDLFRQIRNHHLNFTVYGPLYLMNEDLLSGQQLKNYDNDILVPAGTWNNKEFSAFGQAYLERFGRLPGMVAAYAFDGMNILIEGIRKSGSSEHEKIQEALYGLTFNGVTGTIHFDSKGNRSGDPSIVKLSNGVPIKKDTGHH